MGTPIIVQYRINAPLEKVWKALTDKNDMRSWYFDISDFELETGRQFNFYEPGNEKKYHHQGRILEIIPGQKLKYSWTYPELSSEKTFVTWELQPEGGGTLVTLIHDDIDSFKDLGEGFLRDSFRKGWNAIIGESLKLYLEK
ncbi:uncharacterized protein YndB with AHSA1/START domain [Chryseobacterium sp. H1D6B]|uniref:SRPBCC family protein n=1 Tax=Chryseobacterium sp. H1D6B TaxID=2940588 RepID=UPI0015C728D0|nr:SRPBCC domain-containing protein [Chryseobacterium sp. H1D6B]MDH6254342.1 uncharacterized protein YndB with AHSA1/START domain [Chryseobacterium sp. H1D6B]